MDDESLDPLLLLLVPPAAEDIAELKDVVDEVVLLLIELSPALVFGEA